MQIPALKSTSQELCVCVLWSHIFLLYQIEIQTNDIYILCKLTHAHCCFWEGRIGDSFWLQRILWLVTGKLHCSGVLFSSSPVLWEAHIRKPSPWNLLYPGSAGIYQVNDLVSESLSIQSFAWVTWSTYLRQQLRASGNIRENLVCNFFDRCKASTHRQGREPGNRILIFHMPRAVFPRSVTYSRS